jgi:hypothetical protein
MGIAAATLTAIAANRKHDEEALDYRGPLLLCWEARVSMLGGHCSTERLMPIIKGGVDRSR